MSSDAPWQRYEVPGSTRATVISKPEVVASLLKKAKSPLIVVAHEIDQPGTPSPGPVDLIIRISREAGVPVVATPSAAPSLRKQGFDPVLTLSTMEIGTRINDPGWSAPGTHGHPDIVVLIGFPYIMGWLLESGLKSFAPEGMRFISIDRRYQPHCNFSFPNQSMDEWISNLSAIATGVGSR